MKTAEVVIVGAGLVGASIAWHLARVEDEAVGREVQHPVARDEPLQIGFAGRGVVKNDNAGSRVVAGSAAPPASRRILFNGRRSWRRATGGSERRQVQGR